MPAYATQTAPKQTQNSQQQPKKQKPEAPKGLAALPQSAGIAALVVMVALALPIGNFRALQNATPQAFIRQGDVKSIVEDRISAAQNAVTVAQRSSVSQTTLEDVNNAIKAMQSAKTARDISRADQHFNIFIIDQIMIVKHILDILAIDSKDCITGLQLHFLCNTTGNN